jgi:hypothetical protein
MGKLLPHAAEGSPGGAALAPVALGSRPEAVEPTITLTAAQARRIRTAFAKANAVLVCLDHVRSHPLSGAAREARSEIGAAVAHLDRALPPVGVDVITGTREVKHGHR